MFAFAGRDNEIMKMNKHLSSYISYYKQLEKPGFALLVVGPWGIGKTHQVQQLLKKDERYFVSLFGLASTEELNAEIFSQYAPRTGAATKIFSGLAEAAKNVGGMPALTNVPAQWATSFLRRAVSPDKILVLDDLERCNISMEEIFGAVSSYLDSGFRVILITDEEKFAEKNSGKYWAAKEKTIGHTAAVQPMVEQAFSYFCSHESLKSRKFIEDRKSVIVGTYHEAGCKTLRVLKHLVFDVDRLQQCLEEAHKEDRDTLNEVVGVFCAFDIEYRLGRLSVIEMKNRKGARMEFEFKQHANKEEVEVPKFIQATNRYKAIDLESQFFSDDVLAEIFGLGIFDEVKIRYCLNNSVRFAKVEDLPHWKRIMEFDETDDADVKKAVQEMEEDFKNRTIVETGDLLQIFGLKFMMVNRGIVAGDLQNTKNECISYIDEVLQAGKLPPRELNWDWKDAFADAYDGYGYWVETEYRVFFDEVKKYLLDAREKSLEQRFEDIEKELFDAMQDGQIFYRLICHTAGGDNPYALIPVLASIKPENFVDAWFSVPKRNWLSISRALKDRFDYHRVENELSTEKAWALKVVEELDSRSEALSGFSKQRVKRLIPDRLRGFAEN